MADPNIKDEKPAHTRIVINTFPEMHLGQPFIPQHGCTLNFIGQDGKTYFQVQLFFRVMNYNTKEPMYEFRTCSYYFWDDDLDSPDHPDFMPTAVATIQSAIPDFNWYIKNNKSYLTMEKFYTQNPTVENSEKHIRSAYLRYKLNLNGPPKK